MRWTPLGEIIILSTIVIVPFLIKISIYLYHMKSWTTVLFSGLSPTLGTVILMPSGLQIGLVEVHSSWLLCSHHSRTLRFLSQDFPVLPCTFPAPDLKSPKKKTVYRSLPVKNLGLQSKRQQEARGGTSKGWVFVLFCTIFAFLQLCTYFLKTFF